MTIKRLSETLTFNDDDKQIIAVMKKVGAWEKMKPESLTTGKDRTMILKNYVFQWYDNPNDSGYVSFHSTNPIELFEVFAKLNAGASK
jgi:hypothetical protein